VGGEDGRKNQEVEVGRWFWGKKSHVFTAVCTSMEEALLKKKSAGENPTISTGVYVGEDGGWNKLSGKRTRLQAHQIRNGLTSTRGPRAQ